MLRQFRTCTALLAALFAAAGCGIKGPLVPPPPAPPATAAPASAPAAAATSTPVAPDKKP
ncbi:MAG: lipoprotein [Casimicrobiaceae bacterium]